MKHANRWLGWLAAAVLGFGGVLPDAGAETETVDGIPWTYTVSGGKASLGGGRWSGERAVPTTTAGAIAIPATLGGCPVTDIGEAAFRDCASLTGVTIPAGVTRIGNDAFERCSSLADVAIPGTVTSIGGRAFILCGSLTNVAIPDSVTDIGFGAFRGCGSLAEVTFGAGLVNIGAMAFYQCGSLADVTIPDGVKRIEGDAFSYCNGLTDVAIPDSVTYLGGNVFGCCSGLTNVTIGAGVTNASSRLFSGCGALQAISVAAENPAYRSVSGHLVTKDGRTLLDGRNGDVVIPEGVENIEMTAFQGRDGLTSLTIGPGVTNVGNYAFAGCTNLVRATVADSLPHLGSHSLLHCRGLRSLEVPAAWYGTTIVEEALQAPVWFPVTYRGIDPLSVAVEGLPAAKEGEAFAAALEAAGGVGPCTWRAGAVRYGESSGASTYAETTSPSKAWQWYEAEHCWDVELPFPFPFFGGLHTKAKIASNGAISFGKLPFYWGGYDEATFLGTPVIAAMLENLSLQNGGVFMEEGAGWVKVQWRAAYEGGGAVNFSATLHEDGRIVFSYGAGNKIGGFIGISAGDGETVLVSGKSGTGRMRNAQDIVFTPVRGMPEWLELTADGVLRGTPEEGGNHPVTVFVEDAAGVLARKDLALVVEDAVVPATQRVVFDANGGTCRKTSLTAVVGETYTKLASVTRDGHSFLGWYDAPEGGTRVRVGDAVTPLSKRTLWAHWGAPRQTVRFDANGGTCAKTSVKCSIGDTYDHFVIPVREYYKFLGWYDEQEGGRRVRVGDIVSDRSELTLWARWGGPRQTVRFDANGGTYAKTAVKYFIGETYAGFKIPSREGFQFKGWYDAKEGGKRVRNGMTVTEDAERTLYAHWQATAASLSITGVSRTSLLVPSSRDARSAGEQEFTLRFEVLADVAYEVQWASSLDGEWTVLEHWIAEEDGEAEIPIPVRPDIPAGFYRLAIADGE